MRVPVHAAHPALARAPAARRITSQPKQARAYRYARELFPTRPPHLKSLSSRRSSPPPSSPPHHRRLHRHRIAATTSPPTDISALTSPTKPQNTGWLGNPVCNVANTVSSTLWYRIKPAPSKYIISHKPRNLPPHPLPATTSQPHPYTAAATPSSPRPPAATQAPRPPTPHCTVAQTTFPHSHPRSSGRSSNSSTRTTST